VAAVLIASLRRPVVRPARAQVAALIGDEGDATPFDDQVSVDKISNMLHEQGFQKRGNEVPSPLSLPCSGSLWTYTTHSVSPHA